MENSESNTFPKLRICHQVETYSTWDSGCEAVRLWQERPNLVNRRLCGCSVFWKRTARFDSNLTEKRNLFSHICIEIAKELRKRYSVPTASDIDNLCCSLSQHISPCLLEHFESWDENDDVNIEFHLRKMLPRSLKKFDMVVELVMTAKREFKNPENLGKKELVTLFMPLFQQKETEEGQHLPANEITLPWLISLSYGITYKQLEEKKGSYDLLVLETFQEGSSPSGMLCANLNWLKETLIPKLKNWSESFAKEKNIASEKKLQSLTLVDIEEYSRVYNRLKEKYAKPLCEAWQENTDPQKFVFEDISIASYLVVLWEEERKQNDLNEKQSFVDLGCGNGLLVYLLTKEGYKGKGVDIRKRNIWETFGEDTVLLEQPLQPNNCKFEDADWLIGNHSDELTPWIPVIAARSSYKTKFFLLPCCFHDFTKKFEKNLHDTSQYQTYLNYVREIGEACGFVIEEDIQRIPSTKRICHIGRKRTYDEANQSCIDTKVENFLTSRGCSLANNDSLSKDTNSTMQNDLETCTKSKSDFEPREAKEKVRNCTQIDKHIREDIIGIVSSELLRTEQKLGLYTDCMTSKGFPCSEWNCGGSVSLEKLACLLGNDKLQKLKSQCGGLQTLIRNHGYIFKVVQGQVRFKNYRSSADNQPQRNKKGGRNKTRTSYKVKPCWFHYNHPQGCLLSSSECQFAHSEEELRTAETQ